MYFKVARTINVVVILLMSLEIFGAPAAALRWNAEPTIFSEEVASSILGSDLFEKAEEENENTEGAKSLSRIVLADLSQIALSLSACHSPDFYLSVNTFRFDVKPPVHQLNCVFLL